MKKKVLLAAALVVCLAVAVSGSLAYFTAEERTHNVITTGGIAIELLETTGQLDENGNPILFEDVSGVMPGASVAKIVQVKNTGANDAYIRVSVEKAIELAQGVEGEANLTLVSLDLNTMNWTEKDGYYYYNGPLAPDASTEPLFTHVTFDTAMGNQYQGSRALVDVKAYAVQSDNNGATALLAQGWPAE